SAATSVLDSEKQLRIPGYGKGPGDLSPDTAQPIRTEETSVTSGALANSQVCGWVGLIRPNAAKNCPAFICRLNGKFVVCKNASSASTSVWLSLSSLKTMLAKPSK